MKLVKETAVDRRKKARFPMSRELRFKVLENDAIVASGTGNTIDMGSGGICFYTNTLLRDGAFIEVSVSWPVTLEDATPMRLIAFGRVVRSSGMVSACTIDKYEFRTQARVTRSVTPIRADSMLQRWADTVRKESVKAATA